MSRWFAFILVGWVSLQAGTLVQFRTAFGDMFVEMLDEEKPVTVRNFLRYVREGRWTNMFSHRVVPGFIIQGGGFAVTNRGTASVGFTEIADFGPITNEFAVGPRRSNVYGTLAMAKLGGDPNSASSEWFFNLADNSANLDNQNGGFTVFGRVVSGTNVLNVFNSFTSTLVQPTNRLYNLVLSSFPFDSRPYPPAFPSLRQITTIPQVYTNLVFLEVNEVTPPRAGLLTNGFRGVSWSGVPGVRHQVEVSSNLNSGWQVWTNIVPATSQSSVLDLTAPATGRFYRVTVAP